MKRSSVLALLAAPLLLAAAPALRWGEDGHRIAGRVAAEKLPADMPAFFREAAPQLEWLNPEPDRWRDRDEARREPAMNDFHAADHFMDMELVSAGALKAPNRYAFADTIRKADVAATKSGVLPFRIVELTQRLRIGFKLWRAEEDPARKRFLEQRIVNDAGILGHYVSDGANPHHTTIHYNGWSGANPKGYTTDDRFHYRFESQFVGAKVKREDVASLVTEPPRTFTDLRADVLGYLNSSAVLVEELYALDKREAFSDSTRSEEHRRFATMRLAAGSRMLRDLWYTAWATSAPAAPRPASGR